MNKLQKTILLVCFFFLLGEIGIIAYSTTTYYRLKSSLTQTFEPIERDSFETDTISDKNSEADYDLISLLLVGIDTDDERGSEGDNGRSDSIIVVTLNPERKITTFVSIPRDTLVYMNYESAGIYIQEEKINAGYAYGGISLTVSLIEELLDIPIDYYATIDMDEMAEIIECAGGIDVTNKIEFDLNGQHFDIGDLHLDGIRAVKYARMRYEDPNGDYGRQNRQKEVLSALLV